MAQEGLEFDNNTFFAELILPVPIPKLFTYRVPAAINNAIKVGMRVVVQFGQKKILTGIVANLHQKPPKDYEAKYILELIDESEIVGQRQFSLSQCMASTFKPTHVKPIMAPTMLCVVETGQPKQDATKSQIAAASSEAIMP